MKELREKTSAMKPDFWLMGEVIHGEYSRWVNPEMLHSVTITSSTKLSTLVTTTTTTLRLPTM